MPEDETRELQLQELEALDSIYGSEELKIFSKDFPNIVLEVIVRTDNPSTSFDCLSSIAIQFSLPVDYPNVVPEIELVCNYKSELESSECRDEDDLNEILANLKKTIYSFASENIGMPMLFNLISEFQERLVKTAENLIKSAADHEEKQRLKAERDEQARYEGTRVTAELFNKWRSAFMEEMQSKKKEESRAKLLEAGRMTGKQLFLSDKTLDISDLQFLNLADTKTMEIDETLFEDDIDIPNSSDSEDDVPS